MRALQAHLASVPDFAWVVALCCCHDLDSLRGPACSSEDRALDVVVRTPDKLDVLFVVDDSKGMLESQRKLREQLPHLIDVLTSGRRPDGSRFSPFRDLHLGVVSANLGAPSRNDVEECVGFGDDGVMNDVPDPDVAGCPRDPYPNRFLEFQEDGGIPRRQVASDLACPASLGTDGCGYQQPLEAGLKALWPAIDIDPETGMQWLQGTGRHQARRFVSSVPGWRARDSAPAATSLSS